MRECEKYIKENSSTWREGEIERRRIREKEDRLGRARAKQEAVRNAGLKKMKEKRIDELMLKLPREERMRIEAEEKRKKAMVLREIEDNV